MTHGLLSKCTISQGIWNCLFKHDVFSIVCVFFGSGYNNNTEILEES